MMTHVKNRESNGEEDRAKGSGPGLYTLLRVQRDTLNH